MLPEIKKQNGFSYVFIIGVVFLLVVLLFICWRIPGLWNSPKTSKDFSNQTPALEIPTDIDREELEKVTDDIFSKEVDSPNGIQLRNENYGFQILSSGNRYEESQGKDWVPRPRDSEYILQIGYRLDLVKRSLYHNGAINISVIKDTDQVDLTNFTEAVKFVEKQLNIGFEKNGIKSTKILDKWEKEVLELYEPGEENRPSDFGERYVYVLKHKGNIITIEKYINTNDTISDYNEILNKALDSLVFF